MDRSDDVDLQEQGDETVSELSSHQRSPETISCASLPCCTQPPRTTLLKLCTRQQEKLTMTWSITDEEILASMISDRIAYSAIARALRKTRNACIGKAQRLGLRTGMTLQQCSQKRHDERRQIAALRSKQLNENKKQPKAIKEQPVIKFQLPSIKYSLPFESLTDKTCRWPIGDPCNPDFHFCGAPISKRSYCGYHANIAFVSVTRKASKPFRLFPQ